MNFAENLRKFFGCSSTEGIPSQQIVPNAELTQDEQSLDSSFRFK
jgi:hypothetical protein